MADSSKKPIRVRLAPSPTGPLHIGTARTALFNWLFAKNKGGKFILRIEDTDVERSDKKFEVDIINSLKWLGLDWDEGPIASSDDEAKNQNKGSYYIGDYGPYRQSERLDIYEKYLQQLLDAKKAYYCFCSKEELEEERQAKLSQGLPPRYSGRCRNLAVEQIKEKSAARPSVIRFIMPEADAVFKDLIRGQVKFNAGLFGDIVIAKDLRSPLYNFAAVIDDETMRISHVIRGEDHLSNTPKQILLQQAFGFSQPVYAHLPLIFNLDRSKLSKRFNAVSVEDYRAAGYIPDAIINFLALLGWHPEGDKEFLERSELVKLFSLQRVQKAGAVFNQEKLDWLNSQHLKNLDIGELAERIAPFAESVGWKGDGDFLRKVIKIERERIKKLSDFRESAGFFFKLPDYGSTLLLWPRPELAEGIHPEFAEGIYPELAEGQALLERQIAVNLKILREVLEKTPEQSFIQADLAAIFEPVIEKNNKGTFLWPLRAALSGLSASPGPFEILEVLGKTESLRRLELAIQKLGG
ncbi:MAG: glutamate--tRNA ligase [Patescibacteria group bacterium]